MPAIQRTPERAGRRLRGMAPLIVLAAATACGTTVPLTGSGALDGPAPAGGRTDGLQSPGPTSPQHPGGSAGGPAGQGASSATGSAPAAITGSTPTAGPVAGTSAGGHADLRGVTRTTVRIGIGVADDAAAFTAALGLKGLEAGDMRAQIQAVLEDVNRHGGFAGHRVELFVHNYNTAETLNNPDQANQEACASWTEDGRVFAVLLPGGTIRDALLACLAKHQTPLIGSGGIEFPRIYEPTYAQYPDFYMVGSISGERFDKLTIDRAVARGFFTPWDTTAGAPGRAPVRIGIIGYDSPWGALQIRSMRKHLARHGMTPASIVLCPQDFNGAAACTQSSTLQLRSAGVTHVFGSGALFMQNAESQGYRPRYIIDAGGRIQEDNAPAAQLAGAMAASYIPAMDVRASKDPGDPSPAATRCKKVMRDAGQSTTERSALWSMQAICDAFWVAKAAADAAGALTTAGFRGGFDSLGSRVPSAMTWTNHFGPGQHAGVRGVRDLEFDSACPCFVYTSPKTHSDLE